MSSSSANGGLSALLEAAAAAVGAAAAPAGAAYTSEGSSLLVGSGLAGADGLLGRCLTYSMQLSYIDTQSKSTVVMIYAKLARCATDMKH